MPDDTGGREVSDAQMVDPTLLRVPRAEEFDAFYEEGTPPWDIGRPQAAFVRLVEAGEVRGRVLDVGCGTGEHALMAAAAGLVATGIDAAPTAIRLAREKAAQRSLQARFEVWDALELPALREQFDSVLDCGLFHVFDNDDRARFVAGLGEVVGPGGRYFLLCFSDKQPGDWGPRRVRQDELRHCFAEGWQVDSIEDAVLEITLGPDGALAWLAAFTRA
jgi:SAM-dependent methyltransferase